MPLVNGGIELHPGIPTNVGTFGDLSQERARILAFTWFPITDSSGPPFAPLGCRFHEPVTDSDAQIFVLIHDGAIGVSVVTSVVALFDQGPGFPFLVSLRVDQL